MQPLTPKPTVCAGRSNSSMILVIRSSACIFKDSARANASSVQILSTARTPARESGLALNVPKWARRPSVTASMYFFLPPKAAIGTPPPIDLARQMRSGFTPSFCAAPCAPAVRPVLTSSKIKMTSCSSQSSRTPSRYPASGSTIPRFSRTGSKIKQAIWLACSLKICSSDSKLL